MLSFDTIYAFDGLILNYNLPKLGFEMVRYSHCNFKGISWITFELME